MRWHASHLPIPAALYPTHIIYDAETTNDTQHNQSSITVILLASKYVDARNRRIQTKTYFTFKRLADGRRFDAGPWPPPPRCGGGDAGSSGGGGGGGGGGLHSGRKGYERRGCGRWLLYKVRVVGCKG